MFKKIQILIWSDDICVCVLLPKKKTLVIIYKLAIHILLKPTETYMIESLNILGIRTQKLEKATGKHFNLPSHSLPNMEVLILEKVKINKLQYRKEREEYHIRKFNTFHGGLNLKP